MHEKKQNLETFDTRKYYRQFTAVTVFAGLCSIIWLLWAVGRPLTGIISHGTEIGIIWDEDIKALQACILGGNILFSVALVTILMTFLFGQLKSLRNAMIFNRNGYRLIISWACIWPLYDICSSNIGLVLTDFQPAGTASRAFIVENTAFTITFIALTFAMLYRIAYRIAEENRLTI